MLEYVFDRVCILVERSVCSLYSFIVWFADLLAGRFIF